MKIQRQLEAKLDLFHQQFQGTIVLMGKHDWLEKPTMNEDVSSIKNEVIFQLYSHVIVSYHSLKTNSLRLPPKNEPKTPRKERRRLESINFSGCFCC